ncbi:hypothetical protein AB0H71_22230 [Nocardia sp. NPDC050697]|uniref:hypothetical protein n=1 Tax=Nocardia sp. NPDC050697 TaxID=3155158 RepID=UPI0033D4BFBD
MFADSVLHRVGESGGMVDGDGAERTDDSHPARWAERLAEFACCPVLTRRDGPHDGSGAVPVTTLVWSDGPTVTQMRALVAEFGALEPRPAGTRFGFEHRHTARGRAVAVLAWLDRDPARVRLPEAIVAQLAAEQIGYPETAAAHWQARATRLLGLGPQGGEFTLPALRLLQQSARADGWPAALRWLDGPAGEPRTRLTVVR